MTTKIPLLKRLGAHTCHGMHAHTHTPPCTYVLAHAWRLAARQGPSCKYRGVHGCQVILYRCIRRAINKIQWKHAVLQIQWWAPKWPNLPYCPLVSLLSLELGWFWCRDSCSSFACSVPYTTGSWSTAREHVPGLLSQSSSCARDPSLRWICGEPPDRKRL